MLTSIGHFFVSLFGKDHHARHAGLSARDSDAEGKSLTGTRESDRDKPGY